MAAIRNSDDRKKYIRPNSDRKLPVDERCLRTVWNTSWSRPPNGISPVDRVRFVPVSVQSPTGLPEAGSLIL